LAAGYNGPARSSDETWVTDNPAQRRWFVSELGQAHLGLAVAIIRRRGVCVHFGLAGVMKLLAGSLKGCPIAAVASVQTRDVLWRIGLHAVPPQRPEREWARAREAVNIKSEDIHSLSAAGD